MIHHKPNCLHCTKPIDSQAECVFAPPLCSHADCPSAPFHGLCLMEWRERWEERKRRLDQARSVYMAHLNGECECPPEERT